MNDRGRVRTEHKFGMAFKLSLGVASALGLYACGDSQPTTAHKTIHKATTPSYEAKCRPFTRSIAPSKELGVISSQSKYGVFVYFIHYMQGQVEIDQTLQHDMRHVNMVGPDVGGALIRANVGGTAVFPEADNHQAVITVDKQPNPSDAVTVQFDCGGGTT